MAGHISTCGVGADMTPASILHQRAVATIARMQETCNLKRIRSIGWAEPHREPTNTGCMGVVWVNAFSFFHCVASPFHSFVTTNTGSGHEGARTQRCSEPASATGYACCQVLLDGAHTPGLPARTHTCG